MKHWIVLSAVLFCFCVASFLTLIEYDRQMKSLQLDYEILEEEYKSIELENELIKTAYKDLLINELKKVDDYIAWKEGLTALHKIDIPVVVITDEERQEFWNNYFLCTTSEEE